MFDLQTVSIGNLTSSEQLLSPLISEDIFDIFDIFDILAERFPIAIFSLLFHH